MINEIFDKKGIPIKPGDVLKVFHFQTHTRKYYMYKLAWEYEIKNGKNMMMGHHLGESTLEQIGVKNSYVLPKGHLESYEIVSGYFGGYFGDRKKVKKDKHEKR